MEKTREQAEKEIIDAATLVFTTKGFKGATMREIASAADVNLAMLNYYFRSKENLFTIIFDKAFMQIQGRLFSVFSSDLNVYDKIRHVVSNFIDILIENPALPSFVFSEISTNPERLANMITKNGEAFKVFNFVQKQIDDEVTAGNMKAISFMELFINIDSLCVFPFIAKPIFSSVFGMDDMNFGVLMERRKKDIADLLIDGLKM